MSLVVFIEYRSNALMTAQPELWMCNYENKWVYINIEIPHMYYYFTLKWQTTAYFWSERLLLYVFVLILIALNPSVSIVGSLRDREVACSASDRQGSNFESCVWRTVSSQSSHHPQEVLLAQFSLYVHKSGLKPDSFHFSKPFYMCNSNIWFHFKMK